MTATQQPAAPSPEFIALRNDASQAVRAETGLNLNERPDLGAGERAIVARIVSQSLLSHLQEKGIKGANTLAERLEIAVEYEPRTDLLDIANDYERPVTEESGVQIERNRMAELAQAVQGTAETVTTSILGSTSVGYVSHIAGQMIRAYEASRIKDTNATRDALRVYIAGAEAASRYERPAA